MVVMQKIGYRLPKVLQHRMVFGAIQRSVLKPERFLQNSKPALLFAAANQLIGQLPRILCPPPDA